MGAAFVLNAQGLLPFLMPLSVLMFEPDVRSRRRMLPFAVLGGATALYMLWALTGYPLQLYVEGNSVVYGNQRAYYTALALLVCDRNVRFDADVEDQVDDNFRRGKPGDPFGGHGSQAVRVHSVWCAYGAIASLIIVAYFLKSSGKRPFRYA